MMTEDDDDYHDDSQKNKKEEKMQFFLGSEWCVHVNIELAVAGSPSARAVGPIMSNLLQTTATPSSPFLSSCVVFHSPLEHRRVPPPFRVLLVGGV